ncbi:unnamed protein product, partial [Darwinula stevensoni]
VIWVHVSSSRILKNYWEQHKNKDSKLTAIFYVYGTCKHAETGQDMWRHCLIREEELESRRPSFSEVLSEYIYSLQRTRLPDSNGLFAADYQQFKEFSDITQVKWFAVNRHPEAIPYKTQHAVPVTSVKTNGHAAVDNPKPQPEPVRVSTKPKTGIAQMFAQLHSLDEKKEGVKEKGDKKGKEEEKLKLSNETKTGIMALFGKHSSVASRKAKKDKETTEEEVSKEAAAKAEGLTEVSQPEHTIPRKEEMPEKLWRNPENKRKQEREKEESDEDPIPKQKKHQVEKDKAKDKEPAMKKKHRRMFKLSLQRRSQRSQAFLQDGVEIPTGKKLRSISEVKKYAAENDLELDMATFVFSPGKDRTRKTLSNTQESSSPKKGLDTEMDSESPIPRKNGKRKAGTQAVESDGEDDVIPATPQVAARVETGSGEKRHVRVMKKVDKTYMDDEGYLVTKRVMESCSESEDEEDPLPTKKVEEAPMKGEEASSPKRNLRKQASITCFFRKK